MTPEMLDALKSDGRYTVTREGTGHLDKQQVARFCGDWVGCAATAEEAWALLVTFHQDRVRYPSLTTQA